MRHSGRSDDAAERRRKALLRELDLPTPLTLDGLRSCLERHCHRAIRTEYVVMEPGAPSAAWLRSRNADFLFVEKQTSPFHQIHILSCLAAHMLLDETPDLRIEAQLVPDVDLRAGHLIPAPPIDGAVSHPEAEAFAFNVWQHTSALPQKLHAKRLHRQLRPLHSALIDAIPAAAASATGPGMPSDPASLLYQAVIQIRDASLAIRAYGDPRVAATMMGTPVGGLANQDRAAATEASFLAAALRSKAVGAPQRKQSRAACPPHVPSADLLAEAAWLARVSAAFARYGRERRRLYGVPAPVFARWTSP